MSKNRIRFSEFGDDWVTYKLDDIFTERKETQTISVEAPLLSFTIDEGVIDPMDKKTNKRDFLIKNKDKKKFSLTEMDDIIYNPANLKFGAIHRNTLKRGVVSPIYAIFSTEQNPAFMECVVANSRFIKRTLKYLEGTVEKLKTLKPDAFLSMEVDIPSISEQNKIAEFFNLIDERISEQDELVKNLLEQRRGFMQRIFTKKIRFKPDDGNSFLGWTEVQLRDIAERVKRKNSNNETDIPLTISSSDGLVDQRGYFGKTVASKDMSGYYLLKKGEFAYNRSYSVGYDYGSIKRLDKYEQGALSTLYICFALKDNLISEYLTHYFYSLVWNSEMPKICAEGARNHGLLNINQEDFFKINIKMPCDKREQQKIAEFFSTLDEQIENEKEILNDWKLLKKGFLQQMFV